MALAARKTGPLFLTYEDYLHTPDDGRRYELIDGELFVSPAPLTSHQRFSGYLGNVLANHIDGRKLGELLFAPVDVLLDRGTVVQPDLVYVARARLGIVSRRGIEAAPDLVVEVLSESTADRDRGVKQALYAMHGVGHYWIVDSDARSIEERVLSPEGGYELRRVHAHPAVMHSALFPDLAIDLQQVFRPMLSPDGSP